MKKFSIKFNIFLSIFLLVGVTFSIVSITKATTPNPGHGWSQTGDGVFAITGPTSLHTYTFPDTDATVVTTANNLSSLSSTTSLQLLNLISDETGTGNAVFSISPVFTTPNIGVATGTSLDLSSGVITSGLINGQTISSASNFTGTLTVAGNITGSNLAASSAIYTDSSKNLTSIVPTSGQLGYWTRSGTNLYNTNQGDNVGIGTTTPGALLAVKGGGTNAGFLVGNDGNGASFTGMSLNGTLTSTNYNFTSSFSSPDLFINRPTGRDIYFRENNSDTGGVIIKTGGNVGIGTTNPSVLLNLSSNNYTGQFIDSYFSGVNQEAYIDFRKARGTATSPLDVADGDNIGVLFFNPYVNGAFRTGAGIRGYVSGTPSVISYPAGMKFYTVPDGSTSQVTAMTLAPSGNVGIGTTNPAKLLHLYSTTATSPLLFIQSTDNPFEGARYTNSTASSTLFLEKSRSATTGTQTIVQNGDSLGTVSFRGSNGTGFQGSADITGLVDGVPVSNSVPGALAFNTTLVGDSATSEKMRITNAGNVGIGTTNPGTKLVVTNPSGASTLTVFGGTMGTIQGDAIVRFLTNNASGGGFAGAGSIIVTQDVAGNNSTSRMTFSTNSTGGVPEAERMRIDSTGNVGIGTTGPVSALQIAGADNTTNLYLTYPAGSDANWHYNAIAFGRADGYGRSEIRSYMRQGVESGSALTFNTTDISTNVLMERMRITSSGNVGIGTTDPAGYKLYVNGALGLTGGVDAVGQINVTGTTAALVYHVLGTGADMYVGVDGSTAAAFGVGNYTSVVWNGRNTPMVFATNNTERFRITSTGNVGVGTTAPGTKLQVTQDFAGVPVFGSHGQFSITGATDSSKRIDIGFDTTNNVGFIQSMQNGTSYNSLLLNPTSGNVGINCTDPDHVLEVGGTGTGCNTGTGSYFIAGGTTFTANSSREWKQNINTYDVPDILTKIQNTPARTFDWKPEYCTGENCTNNLGFIAQEFFGVLGRGDDLHVNGQDIMMAEWLGIQHLNLNMESMTQPLPTINSFGERFFSNLFSRLIAWFADSANGIGSVFANVFNAKEKICVDGECLTKSDVRALLLLANPSSNDGNADTTAPVITLTGEVMINININGVYTEQGATATDNTDGSIDVSISGSVDMSTLGTYLIKYNVKDAAGNNAVEVTRTVNVIESTP